MSEWKAEAERVTAAIGELHKGLVAHGVPLEAIQAYFFEGTLSFDEFEEIVNAALGHSLMEIVSLAVPFFMLFKSWRKPCKQHDHGSHAEDLLSALHADTADQVPGARHPLDRRHRVRSSIRGFRRQDAKRGRMGCCGMNGSIRMLAGDCRTVMPAPQRRCWRFHVPSERPRLRRIWGRFDSGDGFFARLAKEPEIGLFRAQQKVDRQEAA